MVLFNIKGASNCVVDLSFWASLSSYSWWFSVFRWWWSLPWLTRIISKLLSCSILTCSILFQRKNLYLMRQFRWCSAWFFVCQFHHVCLCLFQTRILVMDTTLHITTSKDYSFTVPKVIHISTKVTFVKKKKIFELI